MGAVIQQLKTKEPTHAAGFPSLAPGEAWSHHKQNLPGKKWSGGQNRQPHIFQNPLAIDFFFNVFFIVVKVT